MAGHQIGTTSVISLGGGSAQRHVVNIGGYWYVFGATSLTDLSYWSSPDGVTWAAAASFATTAAWATCSVWYDGTYIHVCWAVESNNNALFYRRGTASAGVITWSAAAQTVLAGAASNIYYQPKIICDADGTPFIAYSKANAGAGVYDPYLCWSTTTDGTWTQSADSPVLLGTTGAKGRPLIAAGTSLVGIAYSAAWPADAVATFKTYNKGTGALSAGVTSTFAWEEIGLGSAVAAGDVMYVAAYAAGYIGLLGTNITAGTLALDPEELPVNLGSVRQYAHLAVDSSDLYLYYGLPNNQAARGWTSLDLYEKRRSSSGVWAVAKVVASVAWTSDEHFSVSYQTAAYSGGTTKHVGILALDPVTTLWWASDPMMSGRYRYLVDWDNTGTWGDEAKDISAKVKRCSISYGRNEDMSAAEVGTARIVLADISGDYVPGYASSSIVSAYGGIYPGRTVMIEGSISGCIYTLWRGVLDDCLPDPGKHSKQATLMCVDGFDQLKRTNIRTALAANAYSGGTSGQIVAALDAAAWSVSLREIDSNVTDDYAYVYAEDEPCLDFLQKLENSEFGRCYMGNDGKVHWEDRQYRLEQARCVSTQYSITEDIYTEIEPTASLKSVKNHIILRGQPKTIAAAMSQIWELTENATNSGSPVIEVSGTVSYLAEYADSNGNKNIAGAVAVLASGDYQGANTPGQSGAYAAAGDRTADIGVSTAVYAASAKVQLTNKGSTALYLTMCRLRGKIYTDQAPVAIEIEDTSSELAYKRQSETVELPYYQSVGVMQGIAQHRLAQQKEPTPGFTVTLNNTNADIWAQMMARTISDRVTLQSPAFRISGDYFIEHVEHQITEAGKWHETRWLLSKADQTNYGVWDLGIWDVSRWAY